MTNLVTVQAEYLRKLEDFENVRVIHGITSDEIKKGESLDDFHNRLKAKVEQWVTEHIDEIDADAKK